ncbi:MAG: methyltransferase domain-containing protein [Planctomycetota bacterium]|jgi:chemotaxis methyl-accepting protein methylase|nr:methyltransferase domain-containing protein [Planctomycetota bacterium]
MDEPSRWRSGKPGPAGPSGTAGRASRPPAAPDSRISCRATNPLSLDDDLNKVFLDERQAKATTATRLFRNDDLFNAITKIIVPEYFQSSRKGRLDMWSTGCSSGEEVYSMAMIALAGFESLKRQPLLEVFGTDINRNRIAEARAGVYTRPAPGSLSQRYWRLLASHADLDDHEVRMGEPLRSICKFTLFDMRNRPKKHTFNFIVCNHVMQYYDAPGQLHIISNLKAVLKPGGRLYLEGVTEAGLAGSGLEKISGLANLYAVADH